MSGRDRPGSPGDGETEAGPDVRPADRIAVIGPGRVGQSLAAALSDAGRAVTVFGRRAERPQLLEAYPEVRYRADVPRAGWPSAGADEGSERGREPPREAGRVRADGDPDGVSPAGLGAFATVVFCVPDDALEGAAAAWARALPPGRRGAAPGEAAPRAADRAHDPAGTPAGAGVALHTSGVHGADALAPLRDAGRAVAAWHPLTALSRPRADAFRGATFTVEGDAPAARRARRLAGSLGGRSKELEPSAHARYHAAAVFASNHLVACLSVAAREIAAATGGEASLDDLLPLARAAVDSLSGEDLADGVTGPLARGDAGTVRRHLRALPPESAELYRRLARELLGVVGGRLETPTAEELRRILDQPTGDGA